MSAKPVIKQIVPTMIFVAGIQLMLLQVFGVEKQGMEAVLALTPATAGGVSGWVYTYFVKNSNNGDDDGRRI